MGEIKIITVDSEFDPDSHMFCCGKPTTQKQIDYRITVHNQTFEVPNVWASVCAECGKKYFAPEVGDAIMDTIFAITHPKMVQLAALLH